MAKEKLYKTADEIIEGYGLRGAKDAHGKRKVYLIGRKLNSGKVMLVQYACADGKRQRVSTGVLLSPEMDANMKTDNKEKLRLQRVLCDTQNTDLERRDANFAPVVKNKVNVIDFIENLSKQALEETGKRNSYYAVYHSLAMHLQMCFGKNVTFREVDKDWVLKFLDYMKKNAVNLNYVRTADEARKEMRPLSENSRLRLYRNLNTALSNAVQKGLLQANPCIQIERKEKPREKKGTRVYLELSELKRLIATPFSSSSTLFDLRNAFIFACFCGLRYSDLRTLTKDEIQKDDWGTYINKVQEKTKELVKTYVTDNALAFIPRRKRDSGTPLFLLPKNGNANKNAAFVQWFKDASIEKHITWHCARHTFATLMLSNKVPIATVSKQLGHTKISTTQIYAKIVDEAQADAAKVLSNLLK